LNRNKLNIDFMTLMKSYRKGIPQAERITFYSWLPSWRLMR
jgi:hypothetical protein